MHAAVRVLPDPTRLTAPQPAIVVPSAVNATVPVGAAPVTDAVNVTGAPVTDGLVLDARFVVVGVAATAEITCDSGALAELAFAASPAYVATIACVPMASDAVVQAEVRVSPEPVRPTAPHPEIVTPSLVNATAPVGALPATDAVNVTLVPLTTGVPDVATVVVDAALTVCDNGALLDDALPVSPP